MVSLTVLWLPILLSAIIVFVASSVLHMLLPYHRSDYHQLPDEDKLLASLRAAGLKRGPYIFPFGTHKEMKSPALIEKNKQGPVAMMTVFPSGPPVMPKFLGMWFVYCLIIGFFVAYLTGRTVAPGAHYLAMATRFSLAASRINYSKTQFSGSELANNRGVFCFDRAAYWGSELTLARELALLSRELPRGLSCRNAFACNTDLQQITMIL